MNRMPMQSRKKGIKVTAAQAANTVRQMLRYGGSTAHTKVQEFLASVYWRDNGKGAGKRPFNADRSWFSNVATDWRHAERDKNLAFMAKHNIPTNVFVYEARRREAYASRILASI